MIITKLNPNMDQIDWYQVVELFTLVEWAKRDIKEIQNAFLKSSFTCFVYKDDRIIGFGRTVDDGQYYALLVDVAVHPKFQKQGIGKSIVNVLSTALKDYLFVSLTAAPNKEEFYQKIGWKKQKSAYILPKNEKQQAAHCE
ncbi:GNAT family N-acetyltransferase [Crocinitomix catalasitica]|uniref:GNAT family N-acetyltransferase n=1 Tax=Crocinitomix catalasitica TaxID=184607 RepID=UPI000907C496|nr:GNAT family N-acetyltransferase [Crocinitomix catalasitica]